MVSGETKKSEPFCPSLTDSPINGIHFCDSAHKTGLTFKHLLDILLTELSQKYYNWSHKLRHFSMLVSYPSLFYKKRDQKKRAFRRRRAEVGSNRWGYKSCRQQRAALVLLAADGKRNLPPPPGLTIVSDEWSGYRIEKNNELGQQEKNLFTEIGECSQVAYFSSRTLCPSMLPY